MAMMQGENKNILNDAEYRERYQRIVEMPLSPNNVDSYADEAMDQLSGLIADIEDKYKWEGLGLSDKEREDMIFQQALPGENINDTLDRIDTVAQDLRGLDRLIDASRNMPVDQVILPPDETELLMTMGEGSSGEARELKRLPKLKTALFVLGQDFGVDVYDEEQLRLSTGIVDPKMMRKTSYDAIELPQLERLLLICDENGNRTYVFDTAKLDEVKITPEMLKNGTKS